MEDDDLSYYQDYRMMIRLRSEELWYLFNLYSPTAVIGIENPYTGRLVEEIKISEQFALNELLSKNIVHLADGKTLEFTDPLVKSMVETCLRPDQCLWLTVSQGGQKKIVSQHWVYFSEGQIVDILREGDQAYWLTDVRDGEVLAQYLKEFLSPDTKDDAAGAEFVLEQTAFDVATKAIDSGNAAAGKKILASAGLNNLSIKGLLSALGEEGRSMIAVNISNASHPQQSHMQGLGYLASRSGGWLMKQYQQDGIGYVRFQPGKAEEFRELTFAMVQ